MTAEVFLDTNILLYACSSAPADKEKRTIAEGLILDRDFALSAQVLQEFVANALRKPALGISENGIDATLELSTWASVLPITPELVISATILRRQFQISPWDATIVAAALELGCQTLYSEDLNPGQDYDGVRVLNPFQ
ncbi:MAG: PIN domain-containing protein [Opitutales bacterium]